MSRTAIIAFGLTLLTTPVVAADIYSDDGSVVFINGWIKPTDVAAFSQVVSPEARLISLDSPGGKLTPALQIGNLVRARGLATVVHEGATCGSACGLIWLSGAKRYLDPSARIGLHGTKLKETGEPYAPGNARQETFMRSLGDVPEAVIAIPAAVSPRQMRWIDHEEAAEFGLLAHIPLPQPRPVIVTEVAPRPTQGMRKQQIARPVFGPVDVIIGIITIRFRIAGTH